MLARNVYPFLGEMHDLVSSEAPEWASEDPVYSFEKSEEFARNFFRKNKLPKDFDQILARFVINRLSFDSGNYDSLACIGWFYANIINALPSGKSKEISKNALNTIWNDLTEKNETEQFSSLFNPAILDILHDNNKARFISQLQNFVNDTLESGENPKALRIMDAHTERGAYLGIYNFDDEREIFAQAFLEKPGINHLVGSYGRVFFKWEVMSAFSNLLSLGTDWQKQNLAETLVSRAKSWELIYISAEMLEDEDACAFPLIFNTALMDALPEEKKQHYAQKLLAAAQGHITKACATMRDPDTLSRNFIAALPEDLAVDMTQINAYIALNMDISAKDGDYGSAQGYRFRANLLNKAYARTPEAYRPYFEQVILENLRRAPPERRYEMLLKTAILLRNPLSASGDTQTQEINFYAPRHPTASATARIKPAPGLSSAFNTYTGLVTIDHFIGTPQDFCDAVAPEFEYHGAPRDYPPHRQEIFPQERHKPLAAPHEQRRSGNNRFAHN